MKKAVIIIALLAITAAGCNQTTKNQAADTEKQLSDIITSASQNEELAIGTLKDFYTLWITENAKTADFDKNAIADIERKYISKELSAKLKKAFAEYELDYDPFLNAQDYEVSWLKTLEINRIPTQNNAYIICYKYDNEPTNCMTLFLVKKDGKYLINDILGATK